jgi:hypothetical protein
MLRADAERDRTAGMVRGAGMAGERVLQIL